MEKGKKLSYQQREVMKRNGIKDCRDWLFIKHEIVNPDGTKNLQKGEKITRMIVRNVVTGEQKKFTM